MIHHFEILSVPVLRNNTQLRDLCPVYSKRRQKNYTHLYIGEYPKGQLGCLLLRFAIFAIFCFSVCCDCLYRRFVFLNDSPLAQKEIYQFAALWISACAFRALAMMV